VAHGLAIRADDPPRRKVRRREAADPGCVLVVVLVDVVVVVVDVGDVDGRVVEEVVVEMALPGIRLPS